MQQSKFLTASLIVIAMACQPALITPVYAGSKKSTSTAKADDPGCKTCVSDAASLFARNKSSEAAELLRQWSDRCPKMAQLHLLLSLAATRLGKHDEAEAAARRAIQAEPNSLAAQMQYGMAAMSNGHSTEAIQGFTRATQIDPSQHDAWQALAELHRMLHNDAEATRCAQAAAEADPSARNAKLARLKNLKRAGKTSEAKAEIQQLLKDNPGPQLAKDLAQEALQIGAFAEAVTASSVVTKAFPDATTAHSAAALSSLCLKDFETSSRETAAWLNTEPKNADALAVASIIDARQKKISDATAKASEAVTIDAHSAAALLAKGTAEMLQSQYDAAEASLHECLELDESNTKMFGIPHALARLTLSEVYTKMGRQADAQDQVKMLSTDKRFKQLTGN